MSAKLVCLQSIADSRGVMSIGTIGKEVPFEPKRFFVLHAAPNAVLRGGHAHKEQHQFLVCMSGFAMINAGQTYTLDSPRWGLHVPPMTWLDLAMEAGTCVLVLSSGLYDETEYIRDRAELAA